MLGQLMDGFQKWADRVEVLIIPGNHDCDFHSESRLRPMVFGAIDGLLEEIETDDHEAAEQCLSVQQAFFEFAKPCRRVGDGLHYSTTYRLQNDINVRIECINTAWLSQKHEQQGHIHVSKVAARVQDGCNSASDDFVISVLHHPYGWFDATNRRRVQSELEKNSDLINTGHEHVSEQYQRTKADNTDVQYIEGADPLTGMGLARSTSCG